MIDAGAFDLVVGIKSMTATSRRIKPMAEYIEAVASQIVVLLEGCGGILDVKTVECHCKAHRDVVLMGLGWLIREGYVKTILANNQFLIQRLSREMASFSCALNDGHSF